MKGKGYLCSLNIVGVTSRSSIFGYGRHGMVWYLCYGRASSMLRYLSWYSRHGRIGYGTARKVGYGRVYGMVYGMVGYGMV